MALYNIPTGVGNGVSNGGKNEALISIDLPRLRPTTIALLTGHSSPALAAQAFYIFTSRNGSSINCSNTEIEKALTLRHDANKISLGIPISFLDKYWNGNASEITCIQELMTGALGYLAELCGNAEKDAEAAHYVTEGGPLFTEVSLHATFQVV